MMIRDEQPDDAAFIRDVVREAFATAEHSSGIEGKIVDGLREAGALAVSLVALEDAEIVGHVAISPVSIEGAQERLHGPGKRTSALRHFTNCRGGAAMD